MSRCQPEQWQRWHWQTAQRYYIAELTQDLFGQWLVCRTWGSRTSARGNQQFLPTTTYEQGLSLLHITNQRRRVRGYHPISLDAANGKTG